MSANVPSDFSKATFTVSPFVSSSPELITSIILLSTSETEQVPLVWQVEHADTFSKLTLIDLGVISLITPKCSIELPNVSVLISLYFNKIANVDRLFYKKIDNCQFSKKIQRINFYINSENYKLKSCLPI